MSRFLELIVDDTHYKVGVEFGTLDRSFELMEGNGSTTSMSGYSIRDLIGTNTEYSMTIHSLPGQQSDYDALYEVLTSPVDSHMFKLDNNGVIEEFEAQIESGDDEYLGFENGVHHWDNLSVTFKPIVPQELVEYGGDSPDVPVIDPNIRTMGDLVMTTMYASNTGQTFHTANGTATTDCVFYYDVDTKHMQKGKYAFACCPNGGSASTYYATIFTAGASYNDYGEGFLFNYDGESNIVYSINFASGIVASNIVFSPSLVLRQAENDLIDYVEEISGSYTGLTITRTADWNGWQISGTASVDADILLPVVYNTETFPNGNYVFSAFSAASGASSSTFYIEVIHDGSSSYDYGTGVIFKALRLNPELSYVLHIKAGENVNTIVTPSLDKTYDDETIEDIYERNGLTITTSYLVSVDILRVTVTGTATKDTILDIPYYNAYMDQGEYWFSDGGDYDDNYDNSKKWKLSIVSGESPNETEYTISQNAVGGTKYPNARRFTYDGESKLKFRLYFEAGYRKTSAFVYTAHVYKIDTSANYITSLVTTSSSNNGINVTKTNATTYSVSGQAGSSGYAIVPLNMAYVPATSTELSRDRSILLLSGCPVESFAAVEYETDLCSLRAVPSNAQTTYIDAGYGTSMNYLESGASFNISVAPTTVIENALMIVPTINKMRLMHTGRYKEYGITLTAVVYSSGANGVVVDGTCTNPLNDPQAFYPEYIGDNMGEIDVSNLTGENFYFNASPPNASYSTCYSAIIVDMHDGNYGTWYYDYGRGVRVPLNSDYSYRWVIIVREGVAIQGVMFRPNVSTAESGIDIVGDFVTSYNYDGVTATIDTTKKFVSIRGTSTDTLSATRAGCEHTAIQDRCYLIDSDFPYRLSPSFGSYRNLYDGRSTNGSGGVICTNGNYSFPSYYLTFIFGVPYGHSVNTTFSPSVTQMPKVSMNGIDNWYAMLADGTKVYVISGTAVLDSEFTYNYNRTLGSAGTYHAFGCPMMGSNSTYYMSYNIGQNTYYDYGEGVTFEYNGFDEISYSIVIKAGTEMDFRHFAPTIIETAYPDNYIEDYDYTYFYNYDAQSSSSTIHVMGDRFIIRPYGTDYEIVKAGKCKFYITFPYSSSTSNGLRFRYKTYEAGYYKFYINMPEPEKFYTNIYIPRYNDDAKTSINPVDSIDIDLNNGESDPFYLRGYREDINITLYAYQSYTSAYNMLYEIALIKVPDPE